MEGIFPLPNAYASNVSNITAEEPYFPVNFNLHKHGNISRLRSWSLPDNRTNGSTDSENSDYPSEATQAALAHMPVHHDVNALREAEYIASLLTNDTSVAPVADADLKWSASNIFTPHDADWQHFGPPSDAEFLGKTSARVSPDAVAMTHNSPLSAPVSANLTGTERFDSFNGGFGTGIAEFPRLRGGSLGSDALLYTAPHDERLRLDLSFNSDCRRASEIDELEQAGQHLLAGFSSQHGPHYPSAFGAWSGGRDEMHSENRVTDGPQSARGRSARGNNDANSLTLFDLPQDLQRSGYHSYASTGPSSRDEQHCYSRDSRFGNSPAYSQCPSPVNAGHEWMQHPPLGPNNFRDMSQDPQYKMNAPLKSPSHFVPEDYINGHRRSSHSDVHEQMAYDQGQQLTDGNIYQVQFKRCYRCFKLPHNFPVPIKLGEFVVVEADRGEDLGVVVAIAPADSPLSVSIYAASALSMRMTDSDFTKKILRIATMQERGDLPFKKQQEMILLEVCRDRARDLHALAITLVDAEYQFDRNKLVLHYTASRRIDFREFVRDLFAVYKTRIWMEQATANSNFTPSDAVALALQTGHLHLNPLLPTPPSRSGDASPAYSPGYSPRLQERRRSSPGTGPAPYPRREFYGQPNFAGQQQQESQYRQNLKLQEMRLAQHPHRQGSRYNIDQKCKELQLQKEQELNEELDRGAADSHTAISLPYY